MVLLHLTHKILCSCFLSHHSYSDFTNHVILILTSYLNFEIKKLLKVTLERKSFRRTPRSEMKCQRLRCLRCLKSFVQENKFHTYLIHETLPAEERVSNFHDHGKTPSYQSFADASMRKVA